MSPAYAESSGIELSTDGTYFARTLTTPLFDPSAAMIPGSSQSNSFWVRNASGAPAYLRVSIANVHSTDVDLANALTVSASTSGDSGSRVAISEAAPCAVLTEGQVIPSGGTLRVSAVAALGDLQGQAGQGGSADFRMLVNLSSVNLAGGDRYACLADSGEVPGFYTGSRTTAGGTRSAGQGDLVATGGADVPAAVTPSDSVPIAGGSSSDDEDHLLAAAWNSADLDQWWIVLLWIGAALLGGLAVLGRDRLRRTSSSATTTTSGTPENGAAS
ncbi:hypothetical protein FJ656_01840 [Schumannella luteola]|uniref:Uncharacterized protein n=1 Tax=Schumannella luteola TaxID=472059 RepID=A0A852Y9E1_9MICO|nr:hypothetical protein [Schumannella luteola]NYG99043.1 hypothetical protein [Schumannella luteola]TPX06398.1 hypothetical protein FJ656_01840 [Schumannella luteola]